jgi:hypothetical protein
VPCEYEHAMVLHKYEVKFDGWRAQLHKTTRADAI